MKNIVIITLTLISMSVAGQSNWKAFSKINNGIKFGYKDSKGKVVVEPVFGLAEDMKDGFAVVSFDENNGPNNRMEFSIIDDKGGTPSDSLVFSEYKNLGKGFIKARLIGTVNGTGQFTISGGRINYSGVWGLFYKGKLILKEVYHDITMEANKVTFQSVFEKDQLGESIKSGYITFDGVLHSKE